MSFFCKYSEFRYISFQQNTYIEKGKNIFLTYSVHVWKCTHSYTQPHALLNKTYIADITRKPSWLRSVVSQGISKATQLQIQ